MTKNKVVLPTKNCGSVSNQTDETAQKKIYEKFENIYVVLNQQRWYYKQFD